MDFCLKDNNYLQFKDIIYKQIFGMPMGNPLSPTIADLVMDHLLDECLTGCNAKPNFIVKYVDDIFAVMDKYKVADLLLILNGFHSKLQFTVENENNSSISFLDVKIHRMDTQLSFDWFQKPTASGRLINFRSNQAKHIIFNTASNLINKVFTLSDERFHHSNIIKVTKILSDNGFPPAIIRGLILQQQCRRAKQQSEDNNKGYFKSIVYVPKLAESFKQVVTKNIQDVRLAFKSNQTIRHLFTKLKTKIDRDKRTDVIYKINCKGKPDETCNLCYIGTTKQFLRQRLSNHKSDIKNNNLAKTALAAHSIDKGHFPDFDGVKVLQTEKHTSKRYTLETLHILNNKNNMNRKQDTQCISSIPSDLDSEIGDVDGDDQAECMCLGNENEEDSSSLANVSESDWDSENEVLLSEIEAKKIKNNTVWTKKTDSVTIISRIL
ncbi:uncharacterized protein LOC129950440 [Eupeodes corollae]|uniref:uncharacterized protein LOC129950440 n=1 Tax=Eupeodes corollae TaxID=290404 RepID=UPI0024919D32|nr:uncharacterized protein LOC129950440 [Eupeodes corollae]